MGNWNRLIDYKYARKKELKYLIHQVLYKVSQYALGMMLNLSKNYR